MRVVAVPFENIRRLGFARATILAQLEYELNCGREPTPSRLAAFFGVSTRNVQVHLKNLRELGALDEENTPTSAPKKTPTPTPSPTTGGDWVSDWVEEDA